MCQSLGFRAFFRANWISFSCPSANRVHSSRYMQTHSDSSDDGRVRERGRAWWDAVVRCQWPMGNFKSCVSQSKWSLFCCSYSKVFVILLSSSAVVFFVLSATRVKFHKNALMTQVHTCMFYALLEINVENVYQLCHIWSIMLLLMRSVTYADALNSIQIN